jgi:UDP-N-acetylmuramoylalanine--D-glutamate ligase
MRYLLVGWTRRTSFATAKALLSRGEEVYVSDTIDNDEKQALLRELNHPNLVGLLGRQSPDILNEVNPDIILPSPGVPLSIPLLEEARRQKREIIGDIELFYRFHSDMYFYAITGTDGKTTTTTLTHALLNAHRPTLVGGNIGIPIFEHEEKTKNIKDMVLELSSFQLEAIVHFRPRIAAFLNLAEDHLDRYPDLKSYLEAKKRIFLNQTPDDIAIVNADSPFFDEITKGVKSRLVTFSRLKKAESWFDGKIIYLHNEPLIAQHELKLKGIHNRENVMAASLIASFAGVPHDTIREVLRSFQGLEHRLELVTTSNGCEIYNDSKATTVNALQKALESFDKPIVLIAGGLDKGLDFVPLKPLVHKKLRHLVLIGQATEKIDKSWEFPATTRSESLEDAVREALAKAQNGDVIVFSPGCASFDMFKNYEERGKRFKEIVLSLTAR